MVIALCHPSGVAVEYCMPASSEWRPHLPHLCAICLLGDGLPGGGTITLWFLCCWWLMMNLFMGYLVVV